MGRFDAVLWDVDGTLLDFVYAQRLTIAKCFQSIGREITEEMQERYREINDGWWRRLELGEVTKQQLLTGRFADLFAQYRIENVDVEAFCGEYQEGLGNTYRYMENSLEICRELHGKVRQYVITNGVTRTQENKLKLAGLYDLMDGVFISEQIGTPKPQRGFFEYCLDSMAREGYVPDKSRLLIVGDSLTSDIKGGFLCGIPTCWYRPDDILDTDPSVREDYERYRPDHEISRLEDVFAVLGTDTVL
ncbi:MAG: YjjG family noncanonical pyrimidine nucleotidase [Clostridium sp.]|nr:YjjG family noncanonical pyrimidine nucleotidase [Acetatifactor muris]MCM1526478.1 YjjG family noncanonical pyrimidine nucleotidase [Bacteroides sp.]MCM1562396.1 YjjG family noncanonical pyrimidine nucleotidase [Clostridium sp.]